MASFSVNEEELLQLNVGDFVGVMTHHMGDNKIHWTLGSVESPPYLRDVEIRLWEKQKGEYNTDDVPATEETEALMNRIAQVKGELQNSIEEADALTEQLRARRAAIMQQMGEADEYVAESKAVAGAAREDVESIPDKHWQELKSYRVPPKMVALVIRAVMLLLSEDEARTWPQMQRILRDFNFKQRITGYDPDQQLSPERREYILQECVSKKSFRYDRAMQGSVAVGPIYYWVLAQLDVGEAQSQKNRVDKEALSHQKELRSVLTQLNEQQQRIAEYQELMDDLDDQLRMCHKHRSNSLSPSRSQLSASRSRARGLANNRYLQSFAYAEGKEYLKPAFFPWVPTDRVIIVLRKNVVVNYGPVPAADSNEAQELTDPQIRRLDDGLLRRQRELQELGVDDREGRDFEQNLYRHDAGRSAAEASDKLQRRFEGKNWQRVLERKRMAIVNTFTEESAECLEVPEYYISVDDLTIGSLVVDFTTQHDGTRTKGQLQSKVDACRYPKLMKLYYEEEEAIAAEEAPEHQMKFGGDRWEHILPNHREEILNAFLEDTSKATGVRKDEVEVMDVRVEDDGLTVDYSIKNKNISAEEVQTLVDQHDYAAVWALYQRLSGLVDGAGPLHQVRFRGERWRDLMVGHEEEIKAAFLKDTSNALEVSPERLVTEEMRYDRGLVVPYVVVGECKFNDDDMDQRVEDYKYPEVWALYDRLLAEAAGAEYQKAFEGRHWEAVLTEARPSVTDAFVEDTAAAVSAAPEQVEPCSLDTDDNRLVVCFNVAGDNVSNETVKENVRDYPYPKVWEVYRHTVEELEAAKSDMNKDFEGDLWPRIVHANKARVQKAFKEDAVEALRVGPRQVTVKDVTPGDKKMTVNYSVEGEGLTSYDVNATLNEYAFPKVWKLYKEAEANPAAFGISGRGETAILERRFADDDWDLVLDGAPDELNDAFRRDAAQCLGIKPNRIRVNSCEIGSLIVKYQVLEPEHEDEEIQDRVNEYHFPELYGLYRRRVRSGEEGEGAGAARAVDTAGDQERDDAAAIDSTRSFGGENEDGAARFKKSFPGKGWSDVVADDREAVEEAFKKDQADCLGLTEDDILVKSVRADEDGLHVNYDVRDGVEVDDNEVAEKSEAYDYPALWNLYSEKAEAGWVVTSHQVGFDGEDWKYVLENKREALEKAFVGCTADLFELLPRNVENAQYSIGSLIVDFDLKHPAELSEEEINRKLNECPYEPVWDLYGEHPYDPNEVTRTTHDVGFEGVGWSELLDTKHDAIEIAFVADTAEALGVEPKDVKVEQMTYEEESLFVRANVHHSVLQDEDLIQEQLKRYPYDRLWALYEENAESEFVKTSHQVGFDGTDWKYVVDNKNEELQQAFTVSTAEIFDLRTRHLQNVQYTVEETSLLVDFVLRHPPELMEDEINQKLGECPYDAVWDLYGEHPYDPNEITTTAHEVGFEGEEWGTILENQYETLQQAVIADTADALNIEPECVKATDMKFNDNTLIVRMPVEHSVLQDRELIQEQLSRCPFERVWAIYENAPVAQDGKEAANQAGNEAARSLKGGHRGETEILERRFEDEDWDILLDGAPEDLNDAFRRDAAECLGVPSSNIRVVSAEIGSLVVKYQVIEPEEEDDEIANRLNGYSFPELYGLYRRRVRGGEEGEGAGAARAVGAAGPVAAADADEDSEQAAAAEEVPEEATEEVPQEATGAAAAAAAAEKAAGDEVTTSHQIEFEAEHWDFLVRRRRWELSRAIADDSAEALDISPESAVDMQMEVTPERLTVVEKLQHPHDLTNEEIDEKLHSCPFNRTWAMYENLTPSEELVKAFHGENWGKIVQEHAAALERAFATDSGKSLNLSRLEVEVRSTEVENDELKVVFVVRGSSLSHEEMQNRVNSYPYPETWALYGVPGGVTQFYGPHSQRIFDGESWGDVLTDKRPEVEEAFKEDTAAALNTDKENVNVSSLYSTEKGLVVNYGANVPQENEGIMPKEQVEEKVSAYDYPRLWNLYEESNKDREAAALKAGGDRESGQLERRFEGDDWDLVLGGARGDIDDCFKKGVSDAVGVSKSNVVVLDAQIGSLIMQYKVRGSDYDDDELTQKVGDHDFPELMALYKARIRAAQDAEGDGTRPALPEGWEETAHQAGFDGDDWAYIVQTNESGLKKAYARDTGACLGIDPKHVYDIHPIFDNQLLVDSMVQHPEELTEKDVDQKLRSCPFKEVWSLYGAHPYDAKSRVTSKHEVGFEGEDWLYVLGKKKSELIRAFSVGTGRALTIPASDVVDVTVEPTSTEGIIFLCSIRHNANLVDEVIREQLKAYPYEEIWALYEVRPYDEKDKIESVHQVDFEGDAWNIVCELQGQELRRALVVDTAAAMDIKEEDVLQVDQEITPTALVVRVKVQHSPLQDTEMIQEMLFKYEYENVWALYDISVESEAMTKKFSGAGWAALVESHQPIIAAAFQNDVGVMLNLPARFVKVQSIEPTREDMTVKYSVYGQWFPEDEIRNRAESYPFPEVWGLYKPSEEEQTARNVELGHAEPIQMVFSGDLWSEIEQEKHEELVEAFKKDTADAIGEKAPEKVEVTSFYANKSNGLVANFRAAESGLARDDVEKKVNEYDYPSVWKLYEEEEARREEEEKEQAKEPEAAAAAAALRSKGDRESGQLERRFEGDDWDLVLGGARGDIDDCFKKGVSDAVGVPKSNVVVLDAQIGSLIMQYKVRGSDYDDDELTQKVGDHDFPELMSLYKARIRGGQGEDGAARSAAPAAAPAAAAAAVVAPTEEDLTKSTHDVSFEGEAWPFVMSRKAKDVHLSIQNDTAEALGVPVSDIEDVKTKVTDTALLAVVKVKRTPDTVVEDRQRALEEYEFPRTWALYCPPEEAPKATKRFDGGHWGPVVDSNEAALRSAFQADTSKALNLPAEDIEVDHLKANDENLEVKYTVQFTQSTAEEVENATEAYPYPSVWALYDPEGEQGILERGAVVPGEENFVRTPHTTKFEGEDWGYVLKKSEPEVVKAFQADTAEAFNLQPRHVKNVQLTSDKNGANAQFEVLHSPDVDAKTATKIINEAPYERVWALYEAQHVDPNAVVTDSCDVGFEGDDWDWVYSKKKAEVNETFVREVAIALDIAPSAVSQRVSYEKSVDGMVLTTAVTHQQSLDRQAVMKKLKDFPFPDLWNLYEPRPYDPNDRIQTKHSISFEGEEWGFVMSRKSKEVHMAVQNDTAEALQLQLDDILDVQSSVKDTGLVAVVTVHHSPLQDKEMIEEELSKYEFERVWALYCPPSEVHTLEKQFPGQWRRIVEDREDVLRRAFSQDTAKALYVAPEDVEVKDLKTDDEALTVSYAVYFSHLSDEDIEADLQNYPYPLVWSLYNDGREAGLTELSADNHRKVFEGKQWDTVLQKRRPDIQAAFTKDTAEAVKVDPSAIKITSVTTAPQGLLVGYRVDSKNVTPEQVEKRVSAYDYPSVWNLYPQDVKGAAMITDRNAGGAPLAGGDRESGELERRFEGDDWDLVLDGARDDVDDCFQKGVSDAVGVPKSNVVVLDAQIGSLIMQYKVRGSDYDDDELTQKVGDHDFPELMSLYKARIRGGQGEDGAARSAAPAAAPAAAAAPAVGAVGAAGAVGPDGTRFTDLSVSFEGDDWDYVLEKKSAKLTDAFKRGTATALGVKKQNVTVLEFVLGSLLVQFRVQHPASLHEADMRLKIDSYPYEEVWALYEERPGAGIKSTHDVGFEADNWEYVDRMKHDQIVERFTQATAKACEVDESAVTNVRVNTYPQLMKITCDVTRPASVDASTINTNINRYPYEEVWDLYLDAPVGKESGLLSKTFEGEDWDYTLENSKNALHDAYVNDASRCLQIPRSAVSVKDMKIGSLIVDYTVRTNNMDDSEINSRIDAYPFPEVWSLYKPRESQRNAPTNQRIFKGASWDVVVEKKRNELRDAFVADTAEAVNTPADKVQLTSLYTTEGGLVVNFRAQKDGASYDDIERASRDGEYPRTWELYRQWSDDGFIISEHEVGFDGEDWDYVMEKNKDVLQDTFVMSTAEELGLQSRHLTDITPIVDSKGVSFQFSLKHPKDWKNKEIDAKLKACSYSAVWELYETRPYDPSRIVVTSHEVNFEGEDWDYTLEQKRAEVERAFKEDTAEALNVEPAAVNSVRFEKTENGIVIGANVQHSPLLDKELAADELKKHPFERVWRTYLQRPVGARSDLVSSTHQVGFEGDRWRDVMAARRVRVVDALRVDTAQALHIPPEDVTDIVTKENPNMLVATLTVRHPRANSTKAVQEELSKYEYERVWALYDDIVNPQVDVMKSRTSNSRMSGLLTKRFDGTDWDLALDAYPDRLRTAFVQDTAEVLQSPEAAVVVDGMMLGSLVVQYRVRDLPMSEQLATELANNYAYPRVWALYRSRENNAIPPLASSRGAPQSARSQPAQSALSQTPRRSARAVEPLPENDVDEEAARREAEKAQRAAEEAQRRGDEAARASRAAKEELERADEEARREEEAAKRALERARNRRQNAKEAAEQAQAEEIRRAQEALDEKQRALEAAQKAEEAAEEARRRRVKPLGAEEMMNEEESIKYLRKALADARRERDDYLEKLESAKGASRREL